MDAGQKSQRNPTIMKRDIRKAPSYIYQVEKRGFASVKMQNASRNRWIVFF